MTLNEIQWGRLLALAWLEDEFKDAFEINPAQALRDLREPNSTLRQNLKDKSLLNDDILEELGLDDDTALVDLERIVDYPVDFAGAPKALLDEIIQTPDSDHSRAMPPAYYYWGLDDQKKEGIATGDDPTGTALSLSVWTKIYACIWKDEKPDNPEKKNYKARFERDPALVVKEIMKNELGIQYPPEKVYRLFAIYNKPNWIEKHLVDGVKTGEINGYPLIWIVTKCC